MSVEQYSRTPWYQYGQRFKFDNTNATYMTGLSVIRTWYYGSPNRDIFGYRQHYIQHEQRHPHFIADLSRCEFLLTPFSFPNSLLSSNFLLNIVNDSDSWFFVVNDFVLFVSYFAG